jgi:hypothetical protein
VPPWAMQGVNTIDNVIDVLSPEEVILAFMCILNEISIVFISESMVNITSAVYDMANAGVSSIP